MYNPFSLEGKTILVTGASSGIGRAVAIDVAKAGAKVIIIGRNEKRLTEVKELIGSNVIKALTGDLTDNEFIKHVLSSVDQIDGLVHSAGIMKLLPFKFIDYEGLDLMMKTNFYSPVMLSVELLKRKKFNKNSSVLFISSITGSVVGSKANAMYAASKAALSGIIKSMAIDLAKNKIRVNEIAPGMIQTEGAMELTNVISNDAIMEDKKKYPLGDYGKPNDISSACVFFMSDASQWITGSKLVIDGGFTIQ
ncbi:SDR family oxidoreductase [Pedobacter changchengzhani]|uniref:SDR family oxidoreductase n=1 Tax=Pedobacter changchengzhani TaxID=2529274 RepID=A0A4R5MPS4_9SPHI|nr:SDR family oxidoreductase [Pedobacter changchengzhani]TDG37708.1 SDR family oxidoreductase [Pedobacter changchengzhani]